MMQKLPAKLLEWLKQPGTVLGTNEREFIRVMRAFAAVGVGYGFMQQVIEWEWQERGIGAWGPESFGAEIKRLEEKIEHLEDELNARRR